MANHAPVLVVDDDGVSRHVLAQALGSAGLATVVVGSGSEALAWLAEHTPALVLLDLVMPPPDGFAVLRALRADPRTADVPVVVLTALDTDDDVARAFEAGADDFVRKPFRPVELVARIRGQLRMREYVEALARKERDAKVVLELTQALSSTLDFRNILFTVVRRIAEVARVDRCSIVLVRDQGDVGLRRRRERRQGAARPAHQPGQVPGDPGGDGDGRAARHRGRDDAPALRPGAQRDAA